MPSAGGLIAADAADPRGCRRCGRLLLCGVRRALGHLAGLTGATPPRAVIILGGSSCFAGLMCPKPPRVLSATSLAPAPDAPCICRAVALVKGPQPGSNAAKSAEDTRSPAGASAGPIAPPPPVTPQQSYKERDRAASDSGSPTASGSLSKWRGVAASSPAAKGPTDASQAAVESARSWCMAEAVKAPAALRAAKRMQTVMVVVVAGGDELDEVAAMAAAAPQDEMDGARQPRTPPTPTHLVSERTLCHYASGTCATW